MRGPVDHDKAQPEHTLTAITYTYKEQSRAGRARLFANVPSTAQWMSQRAV